MYTAHVEAEGRIIGNFTVVGLQSRYGGLCIDNTETTRQYRNQSHAGERSVNAVLRTE